MKNIKIINKLKLLLSFHDIVNINDLKTLRIEEVKIGLFKKEKCKLYHINSTKYGLFFYVIELNDKFYLKTNHLGKQLHGYPKNKHLNSIKNYKKIINNENFKYDLINKLFKSNFWFENELIKNILNFNDTIFLNITEPKKNLNLDNLKLLRANYKIKIKKLDNNYFIIKFNSKLKINNKIKDISFIYQFRPKTAFHSLMVDVKFNGLNYRQLFNDHKMETPELFKDSDDRNLILKKLSNITDQDSSHSSNKITNDFIQLNDLIKEITNDNYNESYDLNNLSTKKEEILHQTFILNTLKTNINKSTNKTLKTIAYKNIKEAESILKKRNNFLNNVYIKLKQNEINDWLNKNQITF
jgi:hypothetical protein